MYVFLFSVYVVSVRGHHQVFFDLVSLSRGLSSYVELTDLDFGPAARPKDRLDSALHPVLALE